MTYHSAWKALSSDDHTCGQRDPGWYEAKTPILASLRKASAASMTCYRSIPNEVDLVGKCLGPSCPGPIHRCLKELAMHCLLLLTQIFLSKTITAPIQIMWFKFWDLTSKPNKHSRSISTNKAHGHCMIKDDWGCSPDGVSSNSSARGNTLEPRHSAWEFPASTLFTEPSPQSS